MNDRYLYRAKRTDNGEWIVGSLIQTSYLGSIRSWISSEQEDKARLREISSNQAVWRAFEVRTDTICQCTGLKDKNGKLIWENDIVRFQFDNDDCPFTNKDIKKRIGKVFFSDFRASWSIAMGRNGSKCLNNDLFKYVQNGNRVEVIGNIFDNPELLVK